eukprot:scaffold307287_cov59-Attheya_sp.AAC.1
MVEWSRFVVTIVNDEHVPRPERSEREREPRERDRERKREKDGTKMSTISRPNSINVQEFEPQGRDASIEHISIEINTIDSAQKGG